MSEIEKYPTQPMCYFCLGKRLSFSSTLISISPHWSYWRNYLSKENLKNAPLIQNIEIVSVKKFWW